MTAKAKDHAVTTDDSFVIVDVDKVSEQHATWTSELPTVRPFYAVKCNPDKRIVKRLVELGAGFDCASKREIELVTSMGAKAEDVVFAHPCKQASHLKFAAEAGVSLVTFDNANELDKIKLFHPSARCLLRFAPDDADAACVLSNKYGAHVKDVYSLFERACDLDLDVVGVSFHVGSGATDASAWVAACELARASLDTGRLFFPDMNLVDVGGGFPGYATSQISFAGVAALLRPTIQRLFPKSENFQLIAEPGRFMVATSSVLFCTVTAVRSDRHSSSSRQMVYVNDGTYGSFNCRYNDHISFDESNCLYFPGVRCLSYATAAADTILPQKKKILVVRKDSSELTSMTATEDDDVEIDSIASESSASTPLTSRDSGALRGRGERATSPGDDDGEPSEARMIQSSLWGPTCDGLDCIAESVLLPATTRAGDWMYFPRMGAYTMAAGTSFNGIEPPVTVYL